MKNNKGFAPIAVVLIIVAVLAVGGIAYYTGKSSSPAPQNALENNVTNTPVVNSDATTQNTTSTWKTYSFKGFNFKYPPDWNAKEEKIDTNKPGGPPLYQILAVSLSPTNATLQPEDIIKIGTFGLPTQPLADSCPTNPRLNLKSDPYFSNFRCDDSSGIAVTTFSKNPIVIAVFDKVRKSINKLPPSTTQTPPTTTNSFFVVNSDSGVNVSSPTFVVNNNTYSSINTFLAYMNTLPNGTYNVNISAPGYQTRIGDIIEVPGSLRIGINLDSLTPAHNCPHQPSNTNAFALCGYLADENHNALAGVQVSSPTFSSISATTASDGYYDTQFFLPLNNNRCGSQVTFTYSKSGYKTLNYIFNGVMGGHRGTQLLLKYGSGSEQIHAVICGIEP